MGLIQWLKEHIEMLGGIAFGLGGLYVKHQEHGTRINELELKDKDRDKILKEIHGNIEVLLDRTKK